MDKVEMIRNLTNFKYSEKDILTDLKYTNSAEITLNRIFEGKVFLLNRAYIIVFDKHFTRCSRV
jgi:hypothetical protein